MSRDRFDLALDALLAGGRSCERRGRPAKGPALSYAGREKIYCEFYRLKRTYKRKHLEKNSNRFFNCGRRKLNEALAYHDAEISGELADRAYELSFEVE